MAGPALIKLRLLGRFSAIADGAPPIALKISAKKGIALLAYLALHPEHSVSREKLATLLWGDRPDQQARLNLRQCILSLRKTLAPVAEELIVLEGAAVGLRMELVSVDALDFLRLSRSTELADVEFAASLYGGRLLSELDVDSDDFASWLEQTRGRFEAEAARVLQSCADVRDAAGQGSLAVDAAERLVALDPLREDWQRSLLRMIARHRGSDAALSHARPLLSLLKKELDVEPEPETVALIEDIRRGEIAPLKPDSPPPGSADGQGGDRMGDVSSRSLAVAVSPALVAVPAPANGVLVAAHVPFSLKRAGVGALWFVVPASVLFAASVFLGSTYFTGPRAELTPSEIASVVNADPELAPVVVLPFEAADKNDSVMADLVSDDVIDQLSRVPNLRVISRLTSHQYGQAGRDVVDIGTRLNVRYVIHGSVRSASDKSHVNVELIDVANRLQVWSDQFDHTAADPINAAGAVAKGIGRAIQLAVIRYQGERGDSLTDPNVDALVNAGWNALLSDNSAEAMARSEARFTEALRRESDHVGAMLGLAAHHAIAVAMIMMPDREPYLTEAERLLARVLQRRPGSSPGHYYQGLTQLMRGDRNAALDSFEQSVSLNSSFVPGYLMIGRVLTMQGKYDEAMQNIQHMRALTSRDPVSPACDLATGLVELERDHDREAIEWISRAVIADPNNPFAQIALAAAYRLAGEEANAEPHAARFRELTAHFSNEQRLSYFPVNDDFASSRLMRGARLVITEAAQVGSN